jgi:hypothetical protein
MSSTTPALPDDAAPRGHAAFKALLQRGKSRLADLVALSEKRDPFCAGTPGQVKLAAWFHGLWTQYVTSALAHLRRIHYLLVSQRDPRKADGTPYGNTEACWKILQEASTYARYLGLVDPRRLEDHRNPEPHFPWSWYDASAEPAVVWEEPLPQWTLPTIATDLAADLDLAFPEPQLTGYDYSVACQRYHLEIWVEKSTMNDVLLPITQRYGAVLVTSVGFQSVTAAVQLITQRVKRDGKPTRVFYISDFDPAGDRMPVALARQIEFWLHAYAPEADIKVSTLALTREQVQQYQLPRVPIKESDLRKADFEERHGQGAVELDALEALYPGTLGGIVRTALDPYLDRTLEARYAETAEEAAAQAAERWEAQTADVRDRVAEIRDQAEIIYGRYEEELERLQAALEQELAPLREDLATVEADLKGAMAAFDPALPERPEAAEVGEDEPRWLYSSQRAYWEQLRAYKQHSQGLAPEDDDA